MVLVTTHGAHPATATLPAHAAVTDAQLTSRTIPARDPELQREDVAPTATPTPAPPPTAAPRVAARASSVAIPSGPPPAPGSIQAIIQAAANAHGVSYPWMLKIAQCESGLNPHAYNPAGPYYGLFQFLMSTFRANGGTDIWDPTQQANVAANMLAHGQAHQWGCA